MSTIDFMFEQGAKLKDRVTGFTGIVMVRSEYATGCKHYGLARTSVPKDPGAKLPDWEFFDESRLDEVKGRVVFRAEEEKPSGPFQNPPSR